MVNKQDFLNSVNQNIDMVRGDTLAFNFQLHGLGSRAEYEALEVKFSVGEEVDASPIIEVSNYNYIDLVEYNAGKDLATFSVCLVPNMTKTLDPNRYYYDLQIADDNDNVLTLMRGRLTILYDIAIGTY